MNSSLKNLSEIVASANDLFSEKYTHIDTIIGIMDKTLRNQGMKADAVTIDCITLKKKIVMLTHDDTPDMVKIALGNKDGDIIVRKIKAFLDEKDIIHSLTFNCYTGIFFYRM